jgi:small-conductance mechanosensitive channel
MIDGMKRNVLDFCELVVEPEMPSTATVTQAPEGLKPGMVLHHIAMNYNRVIKAVDGLTVTTPQDEKIQWDASVFEIREPDATVVVAMLANFASQRGRVDELEQKLREKTTQISNQAKSLNEMLKAPEDLQDKYEQLQDDYAVLERQKNFAEQERDNLKKINEQQSELLKQATTSPTPVTTFSTDVKQETIISSLRAENSQLHRDLDKALKSPSDALEVRLAQIEAKLNAPAKAAQMPSYDKLLYAMTVIGHALNFDYSSMLASDNGNSANEKEAS